MCKGKSEKCGIKLHQENRLPCKKPEEESGKTLTFRIPVPNGGCDIHAIFVVGILRDLTDSPIYLTHRYISLNAADDK